MSHELYVAEIGALRGEVNSTIDRMNGNENFCAGSISAIYAIILTNEISNISLVLSIMAVILALLGARRNIELQSQVARLDSYIATIEAKLAPEGGWVHHYSKTIRNPKFDGFSKTRWIFWLAVIIVSVFGLGYVGYSLR